MPYLKLILPAETPPEAVESLLREGSSLVARCLGKPERYVFAACERADVLLGGDGSPAAFLEVRSAGGFAEGARGELSERLSGLVERVAGIPPARTHLNFRAVDRADWGLDGKTLG